MNCKKLNMTRGENPSTRASYKTFQLHSIHLLNSFCVRITKQQWVKGSCRKREILVSSRRFNSNSPNHPNPSNTDNRARMARFPFTRRPSMLLSKLSLQIFEWGTNAVASSTWRINLNNWAKVIWRVGSESVRLSGHWHLGSKVDFEGRMGYDQARSQP